MTAEEHLSFAWNLLRYAYGAVVFLAGLDKLLGTHLIAAWPQYISPFVAQMLPVSTDIFLMGMGVIEIIVGLMLITKFPRLGAYLSVAWLVLISVNLLMLGMVDIAIRDLLLAVGAFVLAQLSGGVERMRLTKAVA